MNKYILLLIFLPFASMGICFSNDTTFKKSDLSQLDWIKVERYDVDNNHVFVFSLPSKKQGVDLENATLMFGGEELKYFDLTVDIALKVESANLQGSFVLHEKYLREAWLIISYEGCDNSYNIKISEVISTK